MNYHKEENIPRNQKEFTLVGVKTIFQSFTDPSMVVFGHWEKMLSHPAGILWANYLLLSPLMGREPWCCSTPRPAINVCFIHGLVKPHPAGQGLLCKVWYLLALKRLEHSENVGCTSICRGYMAL